MPSSGRPPAGEVEAGPTAGPDQGRRPRRNRRGEVEETLPPRGGARLVPRRHRLRGEALKNAVRLTFPKGAQLKDPKGLFNTRLDSKTVRAIDFHEGDAINASALKALIVQGARLNRS